MRSVIVGTAGHIDHGKTALVRALTGIDADRLEEEKRRGITIDLGFAHLTLPSPKGEIRLGFVDVPGHERFVRNMLAGVGGIDIVLLVVAADEGIKPQTREHFDICRMLHIPRGITVLTKCDLVDAETLAVVQMEVAEYLRGSFLDPAHAPMVAVSAQTGEGLEELKQQFISVASSIAPRTSTEVMRLPVDRVFTIKGFGTVVTGTMISGAVHKEDEIELLPIRKRLRVRGIEVHDQSAEVATAGQRTALNLASVAPEELTRGMVVTTPGVLRPTRRFDVSLTLLSEFSGGPAATKARPLRERSRVHLHSYTAETVAQIDLFGEKELAPGQTLRAQLHSAEPLSLVPGDRFIIRQFSPVVTIGGGVVLDASPLRRQSRAEHMTALDELAKAANDSDILAARVARRKERGLQLEEAEYETGWLPERLRAVAAPMLSGGTLRQFGATLLATTHFDVARKVMLAQLTAFHDANRLVAGIGKQELLEKTSLPPEVFVGVLESLVREKKVETQGELVRLCGRGVEMRSDESEGKQKIEEAFASAGLRVPSLGEVLASLKLDRSRSQQLVTLLLRQGTLVKLADDLVFHHTALETLRVQVRGMKTTTPSINVAKFKDLVGVSRKYAIPLLEYLDRERVTRRNGDERIIL
jgi:selenocysteine-specific elongation factor